MNKAEEKALELIRKFLDDNDLEIQEHDNYDGEEHYTGSDYYFARVGEFVENDVFLNVREVL